MPPREPRARCRAHGKINLGLRVTARRADGYHDIATVFHRIGLADEILFGPSEEIDVVATDPDVPSGSGNICHAAALMVREALGVRRGVRIAITKRIPSGAGLGGGSADAAAVLRALPAFWGKRASPGALRAIALRLGSDVPYFLGRGSALGTGRGEILEYFPLDVPYAILVCTPALRIPTSWAYGRVTPGGPPQEDLRALVKAGMKDPALLRSRLVNDFEEPVFRAYPLLAEIKERIRGAGALFASLSGSGSSLYGLFANGRAAERAAAACAPAACLAHVTPPRFRGGR